MRDSQKEELRRLIACEQRRDKEKDEVDLNDIDDERITESGAGLGADLVDLSDGGENDE